MSRKIIITATERRVSPWLSSILTFFFIGLGQVYSGFAAQGIILLLLRILAMIALPFYSIWKPDSSLANGIFASIALFVILSITAVFHSFYISRNKSLKFSWYNKTSYYIFYALSTFIVTLLSLIIFFSFFDLIKIKNESSPLFHKNDIIAVKKIFNSSLQRCELIFLNDNDKHIIVRIIALPGENVFYKNNRFIINDYELPLSIFSEKELHKISVSDYDVISEYNGTMRYPVIKGDKNLNLRAALTEKEFFVSPDNRQENRYIMTLPADQIQKKVEGIIYSPYSGILPGKTFLPIE